MAETDAEALLARLRHSLTHATLERIEDRDGFDIVEIVFAKRGEGHADRCRGILQDIIDGGRSDGSSDHERT